jgi:hypothetical protein
LPPDSLDKLFDDTMDILTFLVRLIEALSWPLAIVVLVIALRKEVRGLVATLSRIKAGPVEAEFGREVAKLHASTEGVDELPPPEQLSPAKQMLLELAEISPRSAILEAWIGVEEALRQLAYSQGALNPLPAYGSAAAIGGYGGYGAPVEPVDYAARAGSGGYGPSVGPVFRKEDFLTQEELSLYRHLRGLRNQVAHAGDLTPTPEAALNFIELTSRLKRALTR